MRVLAVVTALFSTALASNYVIHHRIFHPSLPLQPYRQRGYVSTESLIPTFVPSSDLTEDFNDFFEVIKLVESPSDTLYQVALQNEGESSESLWDFSSVKACYLSKATSETILLYLTSGQDPKSFALDYFVSPIAHDGSCPISKSQNIISPTSALRSFAKKARNLNSTVIFRGTESPSLPELKAPPPLTPGGEIVKPLPEKNFLQKYWMYIGAVLLVIRKSLVASSVNLISAKFSTVVSGGAEEEPAKKK
ncbi:hypothetical protein HYPSUDRAFT_175401 [Hypholoma sublateritium FD-334 SS-4]|uniref:ER membrane protein complex subunit 10 n=1 Tax=Hypholoma sublateritium (strain FD-334 SS-4) TaxID=945553 RepID=A0A0D2PPV3_HYPSF|nr:hypothetical protein HYPSUDRAFT_175401 [Hypholoma sublateritium FD-334 SS-4]